MKGIVIQTYGAGNGPDSRKDLMTVFQSAAERGVILINITQCSRGSVSASYATGKVGAISCIMCIVGKYCMHFLCILTPAG